MQTLELPTPTFEALNHSNKLTELLCRDIESQNGKIDFAQFMHRVLYAPGLGYYASGARKFGREGDFVTAPELSSLFSRTLARYFVGTLSCCKTPNILELGAGSGMMACDILCQLEILKCLPQQYLILEISPDLQQRQRNMLAKHCPHLLSRVTWLSTLPKTPLEGIIVANEILDAMPVHLFHLTQDAIKERFVTLKNNHFVWQDFPASDAVFQAVSPLIEKYSLQAPYLSEVNLHAAPWLKSLNTSLKKGQIILVDYGFLQHEYYHAQRNTGTLMCHYRHRSHTDPFFLPGLQDITAHVDFTPLIQTAETLGLAIENFSTQANFLINAGITELCEEAMATSPQDQPALSQQLQTLLFPSEMGELFKILVLSK